MVDFLVPIFDTPPLFRRMSLIEIDHVGSVRFSKTVNVNFKLKARH
jgi:hypothetical protein